MTPPRYDYIVVGGGSAGCVTAGRLVRDHGARVLLLEAGPNDDHRLIRMPAGFVKVLFRPSPFVTTYVSEPQPSLDGRTVAIIQGRVVGGGSSVNAMTYARGTVADYARWDAAAGGAGWDWDSLLPYFRRQEGNQRLNDAAHGIDGPLKVSDAHHPICDVSRAFLHSLQELGLRYSADCNGGSESGVSLIQSTTDRGRRCSAATAFLDPVRADPRLTLRTGAAASRIMFEGSRAVGVQYATGRGRALETAYADADVILTAGAYATPKLLMLSGIGPATQLAQHDIPVRLDLPGVGQNMQDHNDVTLIAAATGAYGYAGQDRGLKMLVNGLQYLGFGSGPVASTGSEVMGFLNVEDPAGEPNIQLYCLPVMLPTPAAPPQSGHGFTLIANLVAPKSRGSMRLRSADPGAAPIIDPNWLSEPDDRRVLAEGLRYLRRIVATAPLARMVSTVRAPAHDVESDDEILAYCKAVTTTNHHPVGSCRMGTDADPMAVVTPTLTVRGLDGLRIFDCSVMPSIVSANTNAPVMAVADRGVDLMSGA